MHVDADCPTVIGRVVCQTTARYGRRLPARGNLAHARLGRRGDIAFTLIVNFPEVAILGVRRILTAPAEVGGHLKWKVMLPVSLS